MRAQNEISVLILGLADLTPHAKEARAAQRPLSADHIGLAQFRSYDLILFKDGPLVEVIKDRYDIMNVK